MARGKRERPVEARRTMERSRIRGLTKRRCCRSSSSPMVGLGADGVRRVERGMKRREDC